ncbi:unnamed protein product [Miscanthus lutarioriparius]|uniref:Uncharacterized protein n=1 Tax=Miscanthus lutarioriparius TaxID=422564 RepID=A0A811R341_9POAL|nr:unnamed protein product [Miscanthus lutarioriparius]
MAAVLCGERMPRGLCCLTVTRWIVATVVAALAVTVLLLVLTVGLRKESMIVSVHHGHFQVAKDLWSIDDSFNLEHYPNRQKMPPVSAPAPMFDRKYTLAGYKAANQVDIWVSMDFKTPGCNGVPNRRRGKVVVTAVTIFDMPNAPSFLGMVQIATLIESNPREVCPFYRGVVDRWITITNNNTLDYIAKTYGGRSEFTAMLQVDTTTTTDDITAKPKHDTHYCWPVTIGHSSRSTTAEPLTCKHSRGINYTAGAAVLGPPPPPPPSSPPPPQICELCGQN